MPAAHQHALGAVHPFALVQPGQRRVQRLLQRLLTLKTRHGQCQRGAQCRQVHRAGQPGHHPGVQQRGQVVRGLRRAHHQHRPGCAAGQQGQRSAQRRVQPGGLHDDRLRCKPDHFTHQHVASHHAQHGQAGRLQASRQVGSVGLGRRIVSAHDQQGHRGTAALRSGAGGRGRGQAKWLEPYQDRRDRCHASATPPAGADGKRPNRRLARMLHRIKHWVQRRTQAATPAAAPAWGLAP